MVFDLAGFASAGALPFVCMIGDVLDRMISDAFQKKGVPKHSRIHENLKINPIPFAN